MSARPSNVRYVVLLGLCLAAGLAYVHRGCLSVVESTVREDLGISAHDMGWALGVFYWAYAFFQIPTGLLVDRWGPRRTLFLFGLLGSGTVALSAVTLWTNAAVGFAVLFIARLLMGLAQAALFPASTRALSVWIPLERRAFAAGTLQACMSFGSALGAVITARLMGIMHWPWIFGLYALPGLIWSAWFFVWYRDRPSEHHSANDAEQALLAATPHAVAEAGAVWWVVLTRLPVVLLCTQQFFRAASAVFWITWCPTYLQNTYQLSRQTAGELTSLPIVGFMLGSMAGGLIADRLFRRTGSRRVSRCGTAIAASALGVALFVLAFSLSDLGVTVGVALLVAAAIAAGGGNSCSYSTAMDLGGRNLATVFGAMNMFGNIGAALFAQVAPLWVGLFGWPALVLFVGLGYFLGMLFWLPLNPDRPMAAEAPSRRETPQNS